MKFEAKIMNIHLPSLAVSKDFKEGHRDARHEAASIACAADQEIQRLRSELEWAAERLGGFCPGSWEDGIARRLRKALAST